MGGTPTGFQADPAVVGLGTERRRDRDRLRLPPGTASGGCGRPGRSARLDRRDTNPAKEPPDSDTRQNILSFAAGALRSNDDRDGHRAKACRGQRRRSRLMPPRHASSLRIVEGMRIPAKTFLGNRPDAAMRPTRATIRPLSPSQINLDIQPRYNHWASKGRAHVLTCQGCSSWLGTARICSPPASGSCS